MTAAGLTRGDGVLYAVEPSPDAIAVALGVVAAGGVLVLADPGLAPGVLQARLKLARPRWVVAESRALRPHVVRAATGFGTPPRDSAAGPAGSPAWLETKPRVHRPLAARGAIGSGPAARPHRPGEPGAGAGRSR
ncbi:AMP-binding protein [Fodinicola feengrottensis]|uniref:AMP-binding protein n=1 Tax=Fodinicola feengrottensis TaxID=435914 RepID=UPI002441520B|nr:AMP-binding protein [Fodinicola feengrottensis]